MSVEGRRIGVRLVASRSPCDARERTSAAAPVTKVVPPPSACSTAVGPPRRTSPPPGRRPPPTRTPVPPDGVYWANCSSCKVRTDLYQSLQFFFFLSSDHHPTDTSSTLVRLTSHKLFTDKFLAKLWRALWITQPAQFCYGVRVCIGVFLMASCPAMKS